MTAVPCWIIEQITVVLDYQQKTIIMKKIYLVLLIAVCNSVAFSQFTKEKAFNDDATINIFTINLENTGKKILLVNRIDSIHYNFVLHNSDYSAFRTISINLGSLFYIDSYNSPSLTLHYVAENVFDQENDIDLLCQLTYYDDADEEYAQVVVFHENGTTLFESDVENSNAWIFSSAAGSSSIRSSLANTGDGTKMILDVYYLGTSTYSFDVYDLPGTLPSGEQELNLPYGQGDNLLRIYPVPANEYLIMDYRLSDSQREGEIEFVDEQGRAVQKVIIGTESGSIRMPVTRFKNGIYSYKLNTRRGIPRTGKVIIAR